MFGGFEFVILTVLFWVVTVWVFYMVIKAAVRNGILEADARRSGTPRRPYAGLSDAELRRRIAEHEAGDTAP